MKQSTGFAFARSMHYMLLLAVAYLLCGCTIFEPNVPQTPTSIAGPAPTAAPAGTPAVLATPQTTRLPAAATPVPGGFPVTLEPGDTVVTLKWQEQSGASSYAVYRDGNAAPLTSKPLTTTLYTDIGLTNGRTYTYTVVALRENGQQLSRSSELRAVPAKK